MAGVTGPRWEGKRRAREAALRLLYQAEVGRMAVADAVRLLDSDAEGEALELDDEQRRFAASLAHGAWDGREVIDGYLAEAALNWRVERLAIVDRVLLRLAVHEWLAYPGTPPRVVLDEAIDLARVYSGDEAARFVNGVLDGVFKRLKDEGKVVD